MAKVEFREHQFPKLKYDAYRAGIPGVANFLKYNGFNSLEYEYVPDIDDQSGVFVYSLSEQEYTIMVLKYGS